MTSVWPANERAMGRFALPHPRSRTSGHRCHDIRMTIKSHLRALQSRMPWIRPLKFEAYNFATRRLGWHIEPEFRLLTRMGGIGLALDIGGNWGQSIEALKRTVSSTQIISFEPNPLLAARLVQRFADDRVSVKHYALSDRAGEFRLYIPIYHDFVYDGLASLSRDEAENWFTPERFAGFDRSKLRIEAVAVETRTLDSLNLEPEVIKIDVQGAERLVIEGGTRTLETHRPVVIMEAPDATLVQRLAGFGLQAYHYDGRRLLDWHSYTNNVIFLSDEHRRRMDL